MSLNLARFCRQQSASHGVQAAPAASNKKKKGKDKLNNLKRELDMDEHKISLDELCARLGTNPQRVRVAHLHIAINLNNLNTNVIANINAFNFDKKPANELT